MSRVTICDQILWRGGSLIFWLLWWYMCLQVFEAVIAWVTHDKDVRQEHMAHLMEHVRLPLLSREYLVQVCVHMSVRCKGIILFIIYSSSCHLYGFLPRIQKEYFWKINQTILAPPWISFYEHKRYLKKRYVFHRGKSHLDVYYKCLFINVHLWWTVPLILDEKKSLNIRFCLCVEGWGGNFSEEQQRL